FHLFIEKAEYPGIKVYQIFPAITVAQGKHWKLMPHRLELLGDLPSNSFGWGNGVLKLRELLFQLLKLFQKFVKFIITDHRLVLIVIAVIMFLNFLAQLLDS